MHRLLSAGTAAIALLPVTLVLATTPDVVSAATPSTVSCTPPSGPASSSALIGGFHGLTPERLVDTRQAQPVPAGCWLRVTLPPSVPTNAESVALTVTSDRAVAPGFLTVHACGSSLPGLSNLNVRPEGPTSNLALVAVDATRQACIFSDRGTDLIVDLVGWFGDGGSPFQEFAPRRAVDTREPTLRPPGVTGKPAVNQQVEIPRSMLGVPDEAKGVVVNLTVTQASGYGYLTAFPCGGATPTTSNVNYNFGVDRANTAIMALGPQGSLCVQLSESDAHVIVDVNGWLGGDQGIQYGSATKRIADSRDGTGGWSGTFAPGQTRELIPGPDLPFGSRVAVLGITSTQSTGAGFIKVQPCGGQAEVSNLNFVRAVDITNLTAVPLPDDGRICVTASERTHIIVDVFGGFGVPGLARELQVGPYEVFPAFSADQHDYIAYCPSLTANHVTVHLRGMPRTTVTMGGVGGTILLDSTVTIDADDAIVITITPTGGGAPEEYWIRCVPPDFPHITTTTPGKHPPGWYVLGNAFEATSGKFGMILDSAGVPVWYRRVPDGLVALDVEPWSDGSMTWFASTGAPFGVDAARHYERFDLDESTITTYKTNPTPTDHHELLELPNGDVLMITFAIRPASGPISCFVQNNVGAFVSTTSVNIAVPIIQRVSSNGTVVSEWDSDFTNIAGGVPQRITPAEVSFRLCLNIGGITYYAPVHVNSVDMASDGTVVFTARHTDAVYAFDPTSGDIIWKLGGTTTADSLQIVGDPFGGPLRMHDVRVLPNGNISVFDNRTSMPIPGADGAIGPARYVEYKLDLGAVPVPTATMVREVRSASGSFSGAMGSARLQPEGGVVINWGAAAGLPIFTETDPSGSTVFELSMNGANASYRTIKVPPDTFNINKLRATSGG